MNRITYKGIDYELPDQIVIIEAPVIYLSAEYHGMMLDVGIDTTARERVDFFSLTNKDDLVGIIRPNALCDVKWITPEKFKRLKAFI